MPITRRHAVTTLAALPAALLAGRAVAAPGRADKAPNPASPGPILIRGGHVLPLDGPDLARADVHLRDGRIVAVGPTLEVPGAEVIDARGALVLPGFVDTHWHMWNTLARGFAHSAAGGYRETWGRLSPLFTADDHALSVRLAALEAIDVGVTTVHDWAHNTRSPAHARAELGALVESGLRARFAYGYPNDAAADTPMDLADLRTLTRDHRHPRVDLGVCLRGPDRAADAVWRREWTTARGLGLPITTHIASNAAAAAKGSIKTLADADLIGPDTLMVHATGAARADLDRLAAARAPLSLSPWTELEIGYGIPPMADILASGVPLSLSNDNVVLAGRADMFSVMRVTADLAAGVAGTQQRVSDRDALRWATVGGAEAMGLGTQIGTLTAGKRADVIMVRADALNTTPHPDPATLLVRLARPADVDTVIIDGRVHKRGGRLAADPTPLLARARERFAALRKAAGL